jgi:hypothetical protein
MFEAHIRMFLSIESDGITLYDLAFGWSKNKGRLVNIN